MAKPNYAQLIYMYAQEKRLVAINEYVSQVKVKSISGKGDISINLVGFYTLIPYLDNRQEFCRKDKHEHR